MNGGEDVNYDLLVIGAGVGGYAAAIRAAQLKMKVGIVEKRATLGGTCLNVGCIPSKALLESSETYWAARDRMGEHGVSFEGLGFDLQKMLARKEKIVKTLTDGVSGLMKKNKITVHGGTARLQSANRVTVTTGEDGGAGGEVTLAAKNVLVATGSEPTPLPFLPFDGTHVVSSTEALAFDAVPERLAVIGAGAVGLELGSVWARLGASVSVFEILPQIVPFADKQMANALQRALKGQGLDIRLKTKVTGAEREGDAVRLAFEDKKGKADTQVYDKVLVAVGRRPFTEGLGLEDIGVALDDRGRVVIDERFATNVPGVFAVGDVVAGPMLAHKAEEEGVALAEFLAGKAGHVNYDTIPSVVYTDPELASVGLTELQLKEQKRKYKTGRFLFRANGRALSLEQTEGSVKILADAETDALLGVHIVGPRASDLISEAVVAMEFHGSAEDLARTVHAHPTLSEVVKEAALDVAKRAIHS